MSNRGQNVKPWFSNEVRLMDESGETAIYYDDGGNPMLGFTLVRDPRFTARVVTETQGLPAAVPK